MVFPLVEFNKFVGVSQCDEIIIIVVVTLLVVVILRLLGIGLWWNIFTVGVGGLLCNGFALWGHAGSWKFGWWGKGVKGGVCVIVIDQIGGMANVISVFGWGLDRRRRGSRMRYRQYSYSDNFMNVKLSHAHGAHCMSQYCHKGIAVSR